MTKDFELPYFRSVADMCPDAGTGIIVPYPDYPERVRSVFRQLTEVHNGGGFCPGYELYRDREPLPDDVISLRY